MAHSLFSGAAGSVPEGLRGFKMERVRALSRIGSLKTAFGDGGDGQQAAPGCVVYWMSRDQRAQDNWAALYASQLAERQQVPLVVVFNLVPRFLEATVRQFGFLLRGLREVESDLRARHVPFHLLMGKPEDNLPAFAREHRASAVVCDMSPLRVPMNWAREVATRLEADNTPLFQVDAHNVVPVWKTSEKLEYSARTIRTKVHRLYYGYLQEFPELPPNAKDTVLPSAVDWDAAHASLEVDSTVGEVEWCRPGYEAGMAAVDDFGTKRLKHYHDRRNDPTVDFLSNLSPYFHFGQISVAATINKLRKDYSNHSEGLKAFVEESVVRRELSDNFCFYNDNYDNLNGASAWAQETLRTHATDKREHIYSRDELEQGKTHDDLWNASQLQMVKEGKMHGFLRMYWAKKILEWTENPDQALEYALYLNDRYELDGRDPNGFVGCMWSIAGIHDQGWGERPVFGKIRFMNYNGCKRKFKIADFVARYPDAAKNAAKVSGRGLQTKLTTGQPAAKKAK